MGLYDAMNASVTGLALNSRTLVIGASALALLGAGGFAWFFVRPMLSGRATPDPETAQAPAEQAPTVLRRHIGAERPPAPAGQERDPAQQQARPAETPETPSQLAANKSEAAAENPAGKTEKVAAGAAQPPLPPAPAFAPPDEPERMVRRLQDIQERVAAGDAAAFPAARSFRSARKQRLRSLKLRLPRPIRRRLFAFMSWRSRPGCNRAVPLSVPA
ncbi:hypothetical protein [uncultured Rhodoblastus sp.]|uniref:hypothetical protein n=1 Tax=uncultured Rhodoblastus sp. TaxID=543037 RepID=UPI0025E9EC8E|nr:hypothetical protein [uncultured Rhodoblastus sp.]